MARWGGSASKLNSVKTIRQFVSFVLGISVGVCSYSLLRFLPPSARRANSPAQVAENRPNHALTPPWVQRSTPPQVTTPAGAPSIADNRAKGVEVVGIQLPSWPQPHTAGPHDDLTEKLTVKKEVATHRSTKRVALKPSVQTLKQSRHVSIAPQAASAPRSPGVNPIIPAQPTPSLFQAIGSVEKSDGQLEAIIMQENKIQVVHLGDEIAGRYRVTKITPEMVGAVDETMLKIPIAKPGKVIRSDVSDISNASNIAVADAGAQASLSHPGTITPQKQVQVVSALPKVQLAARAEREQPPSSSEVVEGTSNSLGYVQKYDGKVEAVVADGDSVRLIPETRTESIAQAIPTGIVQASTAQGFKSSATVASSGLGAPAHSTMHAAGQNDGAIFRQEPYRYVNADADTSALRNLKLATESVSSVSEIGTMQKEPAYSADNAGSAPSLTGIPFEMRPLGFVVKSDGEFAAILAQDDEVCIVWQGDRFAGHLRAVKVSAESVEVVEDTPRNGRPLPFLSAMDMPELVSISAQQVPSLVTIASCLGCDFAAPAEVSENKTGNVLSGFGSSAQRPSATGILPVTEHGQNGRSTGEGHLPASERRHDGHDTRTGTPATSPATFIFQTLGYVESQDGGVQAIVADGSETYLVKQGEVFADQYQATSVDPLLVLAVKVLPAQPVPDFLSVETDFGGQPASKRLHGSLQQALSSGCMGLLFTASLRQDGHAPDTDLRVNLFTTLSTGLDMHSHLYTTDNPKLGY